MEPGFVCLLNVDANGTTYVAECPLDVPVGLIAEIGQVVGVVKSVMTVRKNSPAYHFVEATAGGIHKVGKVYSPCWNAETYA